jgi:hypothetical protein
MADLERNIEMKRVISAVISATVIAALSSVVVTAHPALTLPQRNVVLDWNRIVMTTVGIRNGVEQVRIAAIAHLAIFEAVNAVTSDFRPYLESTVPSPDASVEAAAIAAAHRVLVTYVQEQEGPLGIERERALSRIADGPAKRLGLALGERVADAMILNRENDGAEPQEFYKPTGNEPGDWQLTPSCTEDGGVFLHLGRLKPFGIRRGDQFRAGPPPRLDGWRFARDFHEVKTVGAEDSDARPADRSDVARFYAAVQSQHVWNPIAQQIAAARRLSIPDSARLFALLNMAMNDALIAVMDSKYHYTFWRPETAIRAGDTAGNRHTEPDVAFKPFILTPCHPSYPSAHASSSYAARAVLEGLHGNGHHVVRLATASLPDIELRYTRLAQVTRDIDDARIYGGIHFRFDQEAGRRQGRQVGEFVFSHNLTRVKDHERDER